MRASNGFGGEPIDVWRPDRRRVTDRDVMIDRDLYIAEQAARGKSQVWIARMLGTTQPNVSNRLRALPAVVRDSMRAAVVRWEMLPVDVLDRFRAALSDHMELRRVRSATRAAPPYRRPGRGLSAT